MTINDRKPFILKGAIGFAALILFCHRTFYKAWLKEGTPLWPDSNTYWGLARDMTHPWQTDYYEPVWIWLIKIVQVLPGSQPGWARYLGAALFLLSLLMLQRIVAKVARSEWVGLLTILFLGLNRSMTGFAIEAVRDVGVLFFVILWGLGVFEVPQTARHSLLARALGFAGAVGCRSNFLMPLLVMDFLALLSMKKPFGNLLPGIGLAVAIVLPSLVYNHRVHGDAFFSVNFAATWWRNYEFVVFKKLACQGCPTFEEIQKGGMNVGTATTPFKWLFGMHSVADLVSESIKGFTSLFFGSLFYSLTAVKGWFHSLIFLIGIAALLRSQYRIWILYPFLMTNFLAFAAHLDLDPRFLMQVSPFLCGVLATGYLVSLKALVIFARRRLAPLAS